MGMLMHHTWRNQQEQKEKPVKKAETAPVEETKEPVPEPVKKPGRRKTEK